MRGLVAGSLLKAQVQGRWGEVEAAGDAEQVLDGVGALGSADRPLDRDLDRGGVVDVGHGLLRSVGPDPVPGDAQ